VWTVDDLPFKVRPANLQGTPRPGEQSVDPLPL
jgi:hypothetical protein